MRRKVGVFNNSDDAIAAIRRLQNLGFTNEEISVVSRDQAMADFAADEQLVDEAAGATTAGAVTGGLVGGLGALLIELGLIAIPGIGPFLAVGPVGAALVGALTGGAVGGLVGALVDMGFEEDEARVYEEQIQQGKILVMVDNHVDRNEDIDAIFNPGTSVVNNDLNPEEVRTGYTTDPTNYNNDPERDELQADIGEPVTPAHHNEDYLAATRRDHMGGGAKIDPGYDQFHDKADYEEAKRRDYMPHDRTEDGLDDWFRNKWNEIKTDLRNRWDKLTDDDLNHIEGDRNRLRDTLRGHYGWDEHQTDDEINDYFGPRDYLGDGEDKGLDDYLRDQWDTAKGEIRSRWDRLTDDHVDTIRGDRGRLRSSLSETYGWTEEETDREIGNYYSQRDFSNRAHHKLEQDIDSEMHPDRDVIDNPLAGQWDQLKGQVQRQWGKLTNDDLDVIRGDRNILKGKLKEYYGYTDDEVERQVGDYFDKP